MHKKIILLSLAVLSVACSGPTEKEIPVTSISISFPEIEMTEGDSFPLTATVLPDNATNKQVTWASTSPGIAFVSQDGVVTALSKGIAMITATAETKSASCKVTVKEAVIAVESVKLNAETLSLNPGESTTLTATVLPENATDKTVTWTSSNPLIASVDGGKVIAVSVGSATITAKAGEKSATCTVSVTPIEVSSVSLSRTSLSMIIGDTEVLMATVLPENAADKTVTWSSSNMGVVTVADGAVKAVGIGSATITAAAGGKSATCSITVAGIDVTSVTLSKSSLTLLIGGTETLTATVSPSNATDKTVTWTTSNVNVATVSDGKVTALSVGSATITASAGGKTATCLITVNPIAVTSVTLNRSSLTLQIGASETLTATVNPGNATNKTVTWSSSNTNVATVSNGKVTAVSAGSATISATAGNKTATCQVTVKDKPLITSISISGQSVQDFVGGTYTITPVISPTDARYDLEWSVSDTRVVNLQKGSGISMILRTTDYGVSEVTVRDKLSGLSDKITVRTLVSDFAWQENTGQTYSGYPLITITEGDEYQLHYTCTPSNATHLFEDLSQFVFYEGGVVSNTTIISLDANGKVKGLKPGTVGIKPTGRIVCNTSAGQQQRIYITVKPIEVKTVTLNKTSLKLYVGEKETLQATVLPANASYPDLTWTSTDSGIVTVENGVVTAIKVGSATIVARASNGVSAQCDVTVQRTKPGTGGIEGTEDENWNL